MTRTVRFQRHAIQAIVVVVLGCLPGNSAAPPALMTPEDLASLTGSPPDWRGQYGSDPTQYGELRLPAGLGPHPVVVLLHGGCFMAPYASANYLGPLADALKGEGIATWNLEYRRIGDPGGGWPGTYLDVGSGVDHLRGVAESRSLDLNRVVVVGHSAGGHLAMWAASRGRVVLGSELSTSDPLQVRGVINLAGPLELSEDIDHYEGECGQPVISALIGGTPQTHPDRFAEVSPRARLPLGLPQVLIWGQHEEFVPHALAEQYVRRAQAAGDAVRLIVVENAGHFELASPNTVSWPEVYGAIKALLEGQVR